MRSFRLKGSLDDVGRDFADNAELILDPPMVSAGDQVDLVFEDGGRHIARVVQPLGGYRYLVHVED